MSPRARKQAAKTAKPKPLSPYNKYAYAAAAILTAGILLGNKGFRSYLLNSLRLRDVQRQLSALIEEEKSLNERIEAVRSDDHTLEKAARKELGYQRPGEIEYRFPPPAPEDE